jgi:hypothetical protein
VVAEFVLTGLSNADGNSFNHEIGICLPHFTVNLTSACSLTIKPKHATTAFISLLMVGRNEAGEPVLPMASDRPARIAEAVNHQTGYYYLEPKRCPQSYSGKIKGAKLLSKGGRSRRGGGAEGRAERGGTGPAAWLGLAWLSCRAWAGLGWAALG